MAIRRVSLQVELLEVEAKGLAHFLSRMRHYEWLAKARDENECNAMRAASNELIKSLREQGFDPGSE